VDHNTPSFAVARRNFLKIAGLGAAGLMLGGGRLAHGSNDRTGQLALYIGTYTAGKSEGIYLYDLNLKSGELKHRATTRSVINPSYITISANRRYLYAVNEVGEFAGKQSGAVSAFAIDQRTGALKLLNQQPSEGSDPCYVTVDKSGKFVLVANYTGGSVAALPVKADGSLDAANDVKHDSGSSINRERQQGPHAHCIILDPANRFAYACDLGTDKIMIYRFDARHGKLIPNSQPFVQVDPGAGPRHLTFHRSRPFAYVINELHATITVFAQDPMKGTLKSVQTIATLPQAFHGENTSADIHVSPDGRFLYCSNRGHNSIAAFRINPRTGKLEFIAHESTGGLGPRNFVIDPTGTFLLAANQRSDNVVTFRIDVKTGQLRTTGKVATVPTPVCLKFAAVE
jgi:6-phosphogluconolactonase